MHKDLKKLAAKIEAQGFTTRVTRKGHLTVYLGQEWITTISGTPSDRRSGKNSMAPLKRAGFRP